MHTFLRNLNEKVFMDENLFMRIPNVCRHVMRGSERTAKQKFLRDKVKTLLKAACRTARPSAIEYR